MVKSELWILGGSRADCTYITLNILTRGCAKMGVDVGTAVLEQIQKAQLDVVAFGAFRQKEYLKYGVKLIKDTIFT